MRRQVKPFTIERKRGGRPVPAHEPTANVLELTRPDPVIQEPETPQAPRKWAAAEALFSRPKPDTEPEQYPAGGADRPAASGRILPNLLEPPEPEPVYEPEQAPRRRGRKPGSRNKNQRAQQGSRNAGSAAQGPETIDVAMRNVFAFWSREDAAEDDAAPNAAVAPEAVVENAADPAPAIVAAAPLALRRRGRLARTELPRGQRWKARLPRFAR